MCIRDRYKRSSQYWALGLSLLLAVLLNVDSVMIARTPVSYTHLDVYKRQLVDSQGNLIGINTAIYSRSGGSLGIGFAIPISIARNVMEQIIQTGSVTRGWIGVEAVSYTHLAGG